MPICHFSPRSLRQIGWCTLPYISGKHELNHWAKEGRKYSSSSDHDQRHIQSQYLFVCQRKAGCFPVTPFDRPLLIGRNKERQLELWKPLCLLDLGREVVQALRNERTHYTSPYFLPLSSGRSKALRQWRLEGFWVLVHRSRQSWILVCTVFR